MNLSVFCIKRPVFAIVLSLVLIILGIMSYQQLTLRAYPKQFKPSIQVQTSYPGASAELIEQNITQKLEAVLADTANLDTMVSYSQTGKSFIILQFKDISESTFLTTQSEVLKAISSVSKQLPDNVTPEMRTGGGRNAQMLMIIALDDKEKTALELGEYLQNNIVKPLERLPGVGEVNAISTSAALRININPEKLKAYQLTINDVRNVLENNNLSLQTGQLITSTQGFQINTDLKLSNISEFNNLPIKMINGRLLKLSDVANVVFSTESIEGSFHELNGKQAVAVIISVGDNANPIKLGNDIRHTMANLANFFPPGMRSHIVLDLSKPLERSVNEVFFTIFEAVALVALITFLFLGNIRAALIPIITIPVCLISTFAIMLVFGFSINMITLLAIVLAVGLVVDDAIVVLENTYRHIEAGHTPFKAAIIAMKEISFAIIGITIALVAVYMPTVFMSGQAAVYFQQFAFTLAGAVLISGFIAITLSPMMCARILKKHQLGTYEAFIEKFFHHMNTGYDRLLHWILDHKTWVALLFFMFIGAGIYAFLHLPTARMPKNPTDSIVSYITTPDNANVSFTQKANNQVMQQVKKLPEISTIFSNGGWGSDTNSAFNYISVKASASKQVENVVKKINHLIREDPSISGGAFNIDANGSNRGGSKGSYSFMVAGQVDYKPLSALIQRLTETLKKSPVIQDASSELRFNAQEYNVSINRPLASELGVDISQITSTLQAMLGGTQLNSFYEYSGLSYPIIIQLPKEKLDNFDHLQNVYVPTLNGEMLPISRFLTITPSITLPERTHYNEMRSAEVSFDVNPAYTLGQAITVINQTAKTILPDGAEIIYTGEAKYLTEGNHSMLIIFILGIIFIYLVLAALFESFIDPLIILLTVPLCIVGAIVALIAFGGSLNVLSGIGLVTLIGLVSKHGILITQFANQLQSEGHSIKAAIIQAATVRLRPILMTTATMVIGAIPLVIATGYGANGRFQIGLVIVAGLIVGTFFSLIVVPVAYTLFAKLRLKRA